MLCLYMIFIYIVCNLFRASLIHGWGIGRVFLYVHNCDASRKKNAGKTPAGMCPFFMFCREECYRDQIWRKLNSQLLYYQNTNI